MDDAEYWSEAQMAIRRAERLTKLVELGVSPEKLEQIEFALTKQHEEGKLGDVGETLAEAFGSPMVFTESMRASEIFEPHLRAALAALEGEDFSTEGVMLGIMMNVVILMKATQLEDGDILNMVARVLQMTATFESAMDGIGEDPWGGHAKS